MTSCGVGFCCCGCTLQQGTLLIGWLMLISTLAGAVVTGVYYFELEPFWYWGLNTIFAMSAALSLLLIVGGSKRKPMYLMLWVYNMTFLAVLSIILAIVVAVYSYYYAIIAIAIAVLPLPVYIIVVVRSYALQLEEERNAVTEQAHTNWQQDIRVSHEGYDDSRPDSVASDPPPAYAGPFNIGHRDLGDKSYSSGC